MTAAAAAVVVVVNDSEGRRLTSGSVPLGEVSSLDHELMDDAMEFAALVAEAFLRASTNTPVTNRKKNVITPHRPWRCRVWFLPVKKKHEAFLTFHSVILSRSFFFLTLMSGKRLFCIVPSQRIQSLVIGLIDY